MRQFPAYSYQLHDAEHRRQFFAEVHYIVVLTQGFGLLTWIATVVLMLLSHGYAPPGSPSGLPSGLPWGLLWSLLWGLPGILLSLALSVRAVSLAPLIVSGALGALTTAWAYRLFLDHSGQAAMWVLPIGITITLASAPVFCGLRNYLCTASAVWLIVSIGHFPGVPGQPDFYFALVAVLGSLCIGVYLNVYFLSLRVHNYQARQELTTLAFKDSITGLNNRRKFTLDARQAQLRTDATPLHFLMIDIDDFKVINDTLGHDAGDQVLLQTALVINRLSAGHLCGRLGGEEFGVVFAGNAADAGDFAARLLRDVHAACQPPRTISIGIAELDKHSDLSVSYREADQALYAAKRAGKNRYVTATPLPFPVEPAVCVR
jgi:diguanylate cyclase (GGDEF)-like protein